jgi:hypothetical protein
MLAQGRCDVCCSAGDIFRAVAQELAVGLLALWLGKTVASGHGLLCETKR